MYNFTLAILIFRVAIYHLNLIKVSWLMLLFHNIFGAIYHANNALITHITKTIKIALIYIDCRYLYELQFILFLWWNIWIDDKMQQLGCSHWHYYTDSMLTLKLISISTYPKKSIQLKRACLVFTNVYKLHVTFLQVGLSWFLCTICLFTFFNPLPMTGVALRDTAQGSSVMFCSSTCKQWKCLRFVATLPNYWHLNTAFWGAIS